MFWNKKDEGKSLPDLPPLKSPFSKELVPQLNADKGENMDDEFSAEEKPSLPSFPDSPIDKGFSQSAIKEAVTQEESVENTGENKKMEDKRVYKNEDVEERVVETPKEEEDNPYISSITDANLQAQKAKPKKVTEVVNTYAESKKMPSYISTQNPFLTPAYPSKDKDEESQQTVSSKIGLPPVESKVVKYVSAPKKPEVIAPPPQVQVVQERPLPAQKNADVFVKIDKFYSARKSLIAIKQDVEQIDELLKKIRETKMKEERELGGWEKQISSIKSKIQDINDSVFEKS